MIIALNGLTRAGKSTVAEYLATSYGFARESIGAPLYEEISKAYGVPVETLKSVEWKDQHPQREELALRHCRNMRFVDWALNTMEIGYDEQERPQSVRHICQLWGEGFRRGKEPTYWTQLLHRRIVDRLTENFVIDDLRNPDDAKYLHWLAISQKVDHTTIVKVVKPDTAHTGHVSDNPLSEEMIDYHLLNSGSKEALYTSVDNLMEKEKWNYLKRA